MISVVVPIYGITPQLDDLSRALLNEPEVGEVIFLDDASPSSVELDRWYAYWTPQVLRNPSRQFFTRTVNRGIRASAPCFPFIAVLNSDLEVSGCWLKMMVDVMTVEPRCALVGYQSYISPGDAVSAYSEVATGYLTWHCVLLRREALKEVGLLPETLPGGEHWNSDNRYSHIVRERGWKVFQINRENVKHHGPEGSAKADDVRQAIAEATLWEPRDPL